MVDNLNRIRRLFRGGKQTQGMNRGATWGSGVKLFPANLPFPLAQFAKPLRFPYLRLPFFWHPIPYGCPPFSPFLYEKGRVLVKKGKIIII